MSSWRERLGAGRRGWHAARPPKLRSVARAWRWPMSQGTPKARVLGADVSSQIGASACNGQEHDLHASMPLSDGVEMSFSSTFDLICDQVLIF
jgi:hypothetical protein